MIFENLSRLVLLAVLIVAPWMFGGATWEAQLWIYAGVFLAVLTWVPSLFLARGSLNPAKPWTPPALLICAGFVLLFAAFQLLPTPWGKFSLSHAVLADWLDERLPWRSGPVPTSLAPAETLTELIRLFFAFCVMALASILFRERHSRTILYAVAATNGAALALFGLIQKVNWNGMLYWTVPLTLGGQPFSSYVNRNNAAGYLNLCLACAFGLLLTAYGSSRRRPHRQRRHSSRHRSRSGESSTGEQRSSADRRQSRRHRSSTGRDSADKKRSSARHRSVSKDESRERQRWHVGVVLGLLAAITLGVVASASRGGILALVAMSFLAVWMFAESRYARLIIPGLAGVGVIAVGVLIWSGVGTEVGQRLSTLRNLEQLTDSRPQHWQDTLQAIPDFPWFGTGLGTYPYAHRPYQTEIFSGWYFNADSEYVEWLLEGGIVGFALMGLLVITAGVAAWRLLARRFGPPVVDAGGVLALTLVGQLLQAATDFGVTLAANQLLMAAILGSAAGRAADRQKNAADESPENSLAPDDDHPLRLMLAISAMILLLGSGCGWYQFRMAHRAEQFRASLPSLSEPSEETIQRTAIALSQKPDVLQTAKDNGQLHLSLARLHIYELRMRLFERLGGTAAKPADQSRLWQQTTPTNLLAAIYAARSRDRNIGINDLLPDPEAREAHRQAVYHLRRAKIMEPLLPDVDLLLACLSDEAHQTRESAVAHLSREAVLSPADADQLFGLAIVANAIGAPDLASRCWHQTLTLEPERADRVLRMAIAAIGESRVLDAVVPPAAAEILVRFAEVATEERDRALEQAAQLLPGETAREHLLRGRIAELQGDVTTAVTEYAAAVQQEPFRIEWRLRLATLYEQSDRLSAAIEQLEFCANIAPKREDLRERLLELQRRLSTSGEDH